MNHNILLVEDDPIWAKLFTTELSAFGKVTWVSSSAAAISSIKENLYDIVFIDLDLESDLAGMNVVSACRSSDIFNVIVSSHGDDTVFSKGINLGANEYLIKPATNFQLVSLFERLCSIKSRERNLSIIKKKFITVDPNTINQLSILANIPASHSTLLITGESGVGKQVVAETYHEIIGSDRPFVSRNCATFNETTLMSELFGHTKGSFTGATEDKKGVLEQANGGVLFLDEIHLLSESAQRSLLKAIDEKKVTPVGSTKTVDIDVKIVCAARENLNDLVRAKEFKDDLFNRIKTFRINLTALKERPCDIEPLIQYYFSLKPTRTVVNHEAYDILSAYHWSHGNTREIKDFVENMFISGTRLITPKELPVHILENKKALGFHITSELKTFSKENGIKETFKRIQSTMIMEFYRESKNIAQIARTLGLSRPTVRETLRGAGVYHG